MKMSIILGVVHMSLGVFMHLLNGIKFRKWYNVFCEFVPQLVFLWAMFGYLVILIFYKWFQDYGYYEMPLNITECGIAAGTGRIPPSLITIMISMALPVFNPITCEQEYGLFGPWMHTLQTALILICLICIPWMLAVKPILLWNDNRRGIHDKDHGKSIFCPYMCVIFVFYWFLFAGEHFQLGEVFVHQMIHSIEFILGTISNTASYLRLWALSLAHSELSIVFYEKALVSQGFGSASVLMIFVSFGIWAGATIGVLVVMEALSAFLHALRLHWVEFQNKVRYVQNVCGCFFCFFFFVVVFLGRWKEVSAFCHAQHRLCSGRASPGCRSKGNGRLKEINQMVFGVHFWCCLCRKKEVLHEVQQGIFVSHWVSVSVDRVKKKKNYSFNSVKFRLPGIFSFAMRYATCNSSVLIFLNRVSTFCAFFFVLFFCLFSTGALSLRFFSSLPRSEQQVGSNAQKICRVIWRGEDAISLEVRAWLPAGVLLFSSFLVTHCRRRLGMP
jgi:hypothetical protein